LPAWPPGACYSQGIWPCAHGTTPPCFRWPRPSEEAWLSWLGLSQPSLSAAGHRRAGRTIALKLCVTASIGRPATEVAL
jgi:hypothetical protein